MSTYIKTTEDGRKVEVIGKAICLDGTPEAYELVNINFHPNKIRILQAVPNATHMAGRLPLSAEQASAARGALAAASGQDFKTNPAALSEFLRLSALMKAKLDGIE